MNRIVEYVSKLSFRKQASFSVLCTMTVIVAQAQTFTTLYSFGGLDGAGPAAPLVQGTDGNLYGTSAFGGSYGGGTAFRITPSGMLTTLYSFCSQPACGDGQNPFSGLIQALNGAFYGTTAQGGVNGSGTIFKITPAGEVMTLYSFCSLGFPCPDGSGPHGGLVQATNGSFYGTTVWGGAYGLGMIFEITSSGALTTLHSFCAQTGCPDGEHPEAGLVQGADGNFYGTTHGNVGENDGPGTVFKITPTGALTTLHTFCTDAKCPDGQYPDAGLVRATTGDFYGTTSQGGNASNSGTIFKLTPTGKFTTLYSFCAQSGCPDGSYPVAPLVQATDGNLYGTTETGGIENAYGTIFGITLSGALTTLHSFCSVGDCSDGFAPEAALVQDTNGEFYGTTTAEGVNLGGTVFSLSIGMNPFVEARPDHGDVAATIKILGTNLTGASSVSFNGTAAAFELVSSSLIETKVPTGATSGIILVGTPTGTLSSNAPFRVLP